MAGRAKAGAVTDAQGRQRFHGAFTGGFSAGYFNTVGSVEGFQPATFKSSRSDRAAAKTQRVEDYMDEDDGLLGGVLSTKEGLDSFADTKRPKTADNADSRGGGLHSAISNALSNIILEPSNTMGKKLLGLLGWKAGQGIGPRVVKKDYFSSDLLASLATAHVPHKALDKGIVTFAPVDSIQSALPEAKADHKGYGFTGHALRSSSVPAIGSSAPSNRYAVSDLFHKTSRLFSSGVTQGYGDEDDEDNVYDLAAPHMAAFLDDEEDAPTAEQNTNKLAVGKLCPSDGKPALEGFCVASSAQEQLAYFAPPAVPREFVAYHTFPVPPTLSNVENRNSADAKVSQRAELLGEQHKPSVFSLLRPEDSARLQALSKGADRPDKPDRPMLGQADRFAALAEAFKNRFTAGSTEGAKEEHKEGLLTVEEIKTNAVAAATASVPVVPMPPPPAAAPAFRVIRRTTLWAPAALLCKRCNVKVPELSSADIQANPTKAEPLLKMFDVPSSAEPAKAAAAVEVDRLAEDVYLTNLPKPPMDLFKSIFESDSEEEEEEEEDDEELGTKSEVAHAPLPSKMPPLPPPPIFVPPPPPPTSAPPPPPPPHPDAPADAIERTENRPSAVFVPKAQRLSNTLGRIAVGRASGMGRGTARPAIKLFVADDSDEEAPPAIALPVVEKKEKDTSDSEESTHASKRRKFTAARAVKPAVSSNTER